MQLGFVCESCTCGWGLYGSHVHVVRVCKGVLYMLVGFAWESCTCGWGLYGSHVHAGGVCMGVLYMRLGFGEAVGSIVFEFHTV